MLAAAKVKSRLFFLEEDGTVWEDPGGRSGLKRYFAKNVLFKKLVKRLVTTMNDRYCRYANKLDDLSKELTKARQKVFEKDKELYTLRKQLSAKKGKTK